MSTVVLAGGTGDLGGRIAKALVARDVTVRALVRPTTAPDRVAALTATGASVVPADFADAAALEAACRGAECVVSALSGLEGTIVTAQTALLDAAVRAGVPRFIPSDFAIDYTALEPSSNRNFDLRRIFRARLDRAPIRATSIWCGGFADLIVGGPVLIVRPLRRVLYWQDADVTFPLTTKDDTAAFTAAAALDSAAPRDLHIAGAEVSARRLAAKLTDVTGESHRLLRLGSLARLRRLIAVVRRLFPQPGAVFPAWQGMQYLHNMFEGRAPSAPIDNARYPDVRWIPFEEVLARR